MSHNKFTFLDQKYIIKIIQHWNRYQRKVTSKRKIMRWISSVHLQRFSICSLICYCYTFYFTLLLSLFMILTNLFFQHPLRYNIFENTTYIRAHRKLWNEWNNAFIWLLESIPGPEHAWALFYPHSIIFHFTSASKFLFFLIVLSLSHTLAMSLFSYFARSHRAVAKDVKAKMLRHAQTGWKRWVGKIFAYTIYIILYEYFIHVCVLYIYIHRKVVVSYD